MLRRLTDLWPNMLRRQEDGDEEEREALLSEAELPPEDGDRLQVDEAQLLADYRNTYWTRLMVLEDYECHHDRKWPMGPDIFEECEAVSNLPPVDPDGWAPLFDPTDFNEANQPLTTE